MSATEGQVHEKTTAGDAVVVSDVSKVYGPAGSHTFALDRLSLTVPAGQLCCLVGASGCGKTTLLNLIAGLDKPQNGSIAIEGRPALLFQDAALFPWSTAQNNIELALRLRGVPKRERAQRARELLRLVHLEDFADRRPHELSGGMRQRVALARALAQDARVLLMDEPFGALDAITRDLLHDELERLWLQTGLTILFVTHNVREAVRLGDRIHVLSSRPAKVVASYDIGLKRPRHLDEPDVAKLAGEITERLRQEVRTHVPHRDA
jgi:NitT/TauT family transport system ATP-binding protein